MNLNITRRVALLGLAAACAPLAALAADPYPTHPVRINGSNQV
jgi:hypothetical protein